MNKKVLALGYVLFFLLLIGFVLIFRPVPVHQSESQWVTVTGEVEQVLEGSSFDVVFRLKGQKKRFYINRGLENGLVLADLKQDLIGQQVVLKHPDYWTPLDPNGNIRHVIHLAKDGDVVFDERELFK